MPDRFRQIIIVNRQIDRFAIRLGAAVKYICDRGAAKGVGTDGFDAAGNINPGDFAVVEIGTPDGCHSFWQDYTGAVTKRKCATSHFRDSGWNPEYRDIRAAQAHVQHGHIPAVHSIVLYLIVLAGSWDRYFR